MSRLRFLSFLILIILISFGTIGGCGGGDGDGSGNGGELAGEMNCTDGIDNDDDTEIDCADIDCILDPACTIACEEFVEAYCDRIGECGVILLVPCKDSIESLIENEDVFDCTQITNLPTANECITDLDEFDCDALIDDFGPESCSASEGLCDECEVDEDCGEGLLCFDCKEDCTGVDSRCTNAFFDQQCEDGRFGS